MKRPLTMIVPVLLKDRFVAKMIVPQEITDDDKTRIFNQLMIMTTEEEFTLEAEAEAAAKEMAIPVFNP